MYPRIKKGRTRTFSFINNSPYKTNGHCPLPDSSDKWTGRAKKEDKKGSLFLLGRESSLIQKGNDKILTSGKKTDYLTVARSSSGTNWMMCSVSGVKENKWTNLTYWHPLPLLSFNTWLKLNKGSQGGNVFQLVGFISESEKDRGEAAVSTKSDGATHILSAFISKNIIGTFN